ncbi:MAG: AfsR/SARP family transcriptional regulator, partial [Solirubrobacteraceae bacterium]
MLTLRTFGAVYVSGADGAPMGGPAAQKRLLALLAVLAAVGDAGMSRDRLVALLWPESEPERARHALTQTLYHARRALDCDDLFVLSGGDIRLNRSRLASDVDQFDARIRAGEHEAAMAVHAGDFLDGFFLSSVAEFEQWTSAQRLRLNEAAVRASDHLGAAAENAHDWARAIEWRKRMLVLDPLSAVSTTKLMNAMAAAGDRTGALNQARVYAALLREQLDLEPDPIVTRLVEHLRSTPPDGEPIVLRERASTPEPVHDEPTASPALELHAAPASVRAQPRKRLRIAAVVAAASIALIAAFSAGRWDFTDSASGVQ